MWPETTRLGLCKCYCTQLTFTECGSPELHWRAPVAIQWKPGKDPHHKTAKCETHSRSAPQGPQAPMDPGAEASLSHPDSPCSVKSHVPLVPQLMYLLASRFPISTATVC